MTPERAVVRGMGGAARAIGFGVMAVLWLPALAIVPAAVIDRGPDGTPRLSPLPLALAVLDPFAWACAANSALAASAVAAGSLLIGVVVGTISGRRRFWGRPLLVGLAWAPLAAGPVILAPGVAMILGGDRGGGWDWLDARSIAGLPFSDLARWAGLVWVGIACGVPIVASATSAAWTRIDPTWSEAARAAGASRRRIARDLIWPLLRPDVGRAVASVFALALMEPAGPMVLGLHRTLAVQVVASARRFDEPTRAATLALIGVALAWLARLLIGWWGGANTLPPEPDGPAPPRVPAMASRRRMLICSLALGAWIVVGVAPILVVLASAFRPDSGEGPTEALARAVRPGPEAIRWLGNGAMVAALALAANGLALITLFGRPGRPPGPLARGLSSALGWFPPLALGVGALALPWLLSAGADALAPGSIAGRGAALLAREMHPARSPGLALILALAAAHLPMLARAATLARGPIRPRLADAALTMGASRRRAQRDRDGHPARRIPLRPALLTLALSLTNLAPALLLVPLPERRTPAPAVLRRYLERGVIDGRLALPIAAMLGANFGAFALASRGRAGPIGGWFRGA
ncbi:ABC transporter permease subunit [Tundrisphaera sp. TA3]|uniref:ABC transporter permease subunit n=1 Tax=Tundrisphaera sp. TA3 TaxID=3435775 RepID=UPI003EBE454D